MRISLSKRIVLLANPRCASTSLRGVLDPYSDFRGSGDGKPLIHHASLRSVERFMIAEGLPPLDEFLILTTIRNPWDRIVSIFHFGLRRKGSVWHGPAAEAGSVSAFAFHPILDYTFAPEGGHPEGPFDIVSFTTDLNGRRPVEVFDVTELDRLTGRLADRGVAVDALPRSNVTERGDYRAYFSEAAAARIGDLFKADIEERGYVF